MKIYDGKNVPIKSWCGDPEQGVLDQAYNLSSLPFIFKQVCLMPDTHQGYGMPIGGVLATKDVIIPNAVGVDIGCGMCAVKTSLTDIDTNTLKKIMGEIRKAIPVGFNHNKKKQDEKLMPKKAIADNIFSYSVISKEFNSALYQLGTLGGGNHFIEIQKDNEKNIWVMVHSGSRNLGKKVADYYNKMAIELNRKWHSSVLKEWQLAFLPADSDEGRAYLREMQYCVDFALSNRKLMMNKILDIIDSHFCDYENYKSSKNEFKSMINIAHNYVSLENHFGQNVYVHRKGATLAREGIVGIIPGSQGTNSYIVKGLGNKESFMSCSHGAGRKMSRTKAIENLSLEEEKQKLDNLGIIHNIRNINDLDEASSAYKDINVVMEEQKDLVDIFVELSPLGVIKG